MTDDLPKPLVPVWNAPLITFAFDHLIHDLNVSRFLINTHHAAHRYKKEFPGKDYRGTELQFRHEKVLLDTGGGLDNIRDWLPESESFIVYNGDILSDLPLGDAVGQHLASGHLATLVLRSEGTNRNVALDNKSGRIMDMRNALQSNSTNLYQFTGIYLVSPRFLPYLKPRKIESIVFPLLQAIRNGHQVGGVVVDEGAWSDLGDDESYLDALSLFQNDSFPAFGRQPGKTRIHPSAKIDPTAEIDTLSSIGANASVGAGASIEESVIWEGARVTDNERLKRSVVMA